MNKSQELGVKENAKTKKCKEELKMQHSEIDMKHPKTTILENKLTAAINSTAVPQHLCGGRTENCSPRCH